MNCCPRRLPVLAIGCGLLAGFSSFAVAGEYAAQEDLQLEPVVVGDPERVDAYPTRIQLESARQRMHLIVTGHYADGRLQDLTRSVELTSSDEQVVRVEGGRAVPVGEGTAHILARVGGQHAQVPVEVSNLTASDPISFHYEVLAALTKQGCNSGACHGSPRGKAGFRLSLMAYDANFDQTTLVREHYGHRTNLIDPESSLVLVKPTMHVAHGGGLRLRKTDPAYEVLRDWIVEGCGVDNPDSPACVKVQVQPVSGRVLRWPAHTQQLIVLAHFSDGSVRDVTPLATYSSSDETVATVGPGGLVVSHDRGQAAIMVRYLEKVESCTLIFVRDVDRFVWNDPPEINYVDRLVYDKLRQLKYLPSDVCSDDKFMRRIYLDVIGVLPEVAQVEAFLNDTSSEKRSRLIDQLLERPEYARFWALKWADVLRVKRQSVTAAGVWKYYQWLVRSVENNVSFDELARQLLTAKGSTYTNPAANYYRAATNPNDCAETTAQLFLGVRIGCAKCHNHPFERWTQDNYYGLAAFFNRVQRKESHRPGELVVWMARGGEVTQPRTGQRMKPWLPLAGDVDDAGPRDRREIFAEWLTREDNPFFARVAVNRIWAQVIGRGIVDPVDDFRDSNPPCNSELLDALARDFVDSGFDQKHILRTILNSRTYQLSSVANDFNKDDNKYFSRAQVRMLSAEQILDAICHVTGVAETFEGMPVGTRATQLPSPDVKHDFLKIFGQPERRTTCACERSTESNLSQALQLFNGPLVDGKLQHGQNRFRRMVAGGMSNEEILRHLYLAARCRYPSDAETDAAVTYISEKEDRIQALEDTCWALMNTDEFLFQH